MGRVADSAADELERRARLLTCLLICLPSHMPPFSQSSSNGSAFSYAPLPAPQPDEWEGIEVSRDAIHELIDAEIASGTPSTDIVLGGFSQGGAMALLAG